MNEEYDVQTPVTDVTENTEAQPVEEIEEGIELTDTTTSNESVSKLPPHSMMASSPLNERAWMSRASSHTMSGRTACSVWRQQA